MITVTPLSFQLFIATLCVCLLSACGGGGDEQVPTPVQMEKINGIEVPPEPDAVKNNATLAGVDVNKNGVRDDIDRKIATSYPNEKENIENIIKLEEMVLLGEDRNNSNINLHNHLCNSGVITDADIYGIVYNTDARRSQQASQEPIKAISVDCGGNK